MFLHYHLPFFSHQRASQKSGLNPLKIKWLDSMQKQLVSCLWNGFPFWERAKGGHLALALQ